MNEGLVAELNELIALKRFANKSSHKLLGKVLRSGLHESRLRGRGMDFAEVRNYQGGDEIRHMEWRVTARTGRPHIKVYQEERERPVVILTDFSPSMVFGTKKAFKSVLAARLSALIAWTAIKQGDRVGALMYCANKHSEFTPRQREHGVLPLLSSLSNYTKEIISAPLIPSSIVLSDELLRLRRVAKPGSIIVLVSDFYQMNEDCTKHLSRLRAHNDILAYHVCDALELAPPKPGVYAVSNGSQSIFLDTNDKNVSKQYQSWCEESRNRLKSEFKRLQIQYTQISTENDLSLLVKETFPGRARG